MFAAATAIGTAPRAFAYTALGGSLGNLRSPEAAIAVAVLVVMGLTGIVLLARERKKRCLTPLASGAVRLRRGAISATARSSRADGLPAPTQA